MLEIAKEVFERLGESEIRYCYWTTTQHLDRAFDGEKDFDLLVDRADWTALEILILECGLKRRTSTADGLYPGTEDFLGFDNDTGAIIHLEIHFELIVGRSLSKNYKLPIEQEILTYRTHHETLPIFVTPPEFELAIIVTRTLLRASFTGRSLISAILGRPVLTAKIDAVISNLLGRIDEEKFERVLVSHFACQKSVIRQFLSEYRAGIAWHRAYRLKRSMASAMQRFVRLAPRHDRQAMRLRRLAKKQSIRGITPGGLTVAFVGADGAGKSSTVAAVDEWLSWKLTVRRYYMGIPKSRRTRMLNLSIRGCSKLRLHSLAQSLNSLKWVYCGRERYLNHRRAGEHRSRGGIVIFDRYPLPELWNKPEPMDGPRVDAQSRWASAEMNYYDAIEPPDYVFVLQVTYEESMRRKNARGKQQDYESLRLKIDAISTLEGDGQRVFTLDTAVGVERSLLNIKRKIWRLLA